MKTKKVKFYLDLWPNMDLDSAYLCAYTQRHPISEGNKRYSFEVELPDDRSEDVKLGPVQNFQQDA